MVFYPNPSNIGTNLVSSLGDGSTINVTWFPAEHSRPTNKIAYHIYYSTNKDDVFAEGVKYVSIDGSTSANLINLTPGQEYFIAVRPVEYDPILFDLTLLPIAYDSLRLYPNSLLREDMTATSLLVKLIDVDNFPSTGLVKVGVELIQYLAVDSVNKNLVVPGGGAGAQAVRLVDQDGYGHFFVAGATNVGDGYINGLTAVPGSGAPTETWTVRCIFAGTDGYGHEIKQFSALGAISGNRLDGYGNSVIWQVNDGYASNGVLNFAIQETSPHFVLGDYFTIKVAGSITGSSSGRGYNNTTARLHTIGGFDGYNSWDPSVTLFTIGEDLRWDLIYICQSRFEYPNYPYTTADGYHQVVKDLLSSDLSPADAANIDFPAYDYAGYHRTDPVQLLDGTCVGSYMGGEMGCIDGYGNYNILRGLSLQDQNTQRQDVQLSVTGRPAVLIKRRWNGITSNTYLPSSEYPDDRGIDNYGGKFVTGYEQYFNPKRSDGRILVRPGPTEENLKMYEAGLESEFALDLWTLTVPTIKTRDILVLFDQDNNEDFRYEVAGVTRNNTILGLDGGQHLKVFRIRKTDPAYQIRIFRDSSDFPAKLSTSIGFVAGIPPHTHSIMISEKIISISQINQTTSVVQGHNHPVINGIIITELGHDHKIIMV